jgi:stage II sporulation protein M
MGKGVKHLFSRVKNLIGMHILNNKSTYFFLLMTFVAGVSAGAFTVNGLSAMQRDDLATYLQGFLRLMENQNVNSTELFSVALQENFKLVAVLWILGVTIIGIPFIFILIGIRGFITGFSSGFLINAIGLKGMLFSMMTVLPKELIVVPCIIAIGVNGINFSMKMIKKKPPVIMIKDNLKSNLLSYCFVTGFFSIFIVAAGFLEAYVVPVFIRMIIPAVLN